MGLSSARFAEIRKHQILCDKSNKKNMSSKNSLSPKKLVARSIITIAMVANSDKLDQIKQSISVSIVKMSRSARIALNLVNISSIPLYASTELPRKNGESVKTAKLRRN